MVRYVAQPWSVADDDRRRHIFLLSDDAVNPHLRFFPCELLNVRHQPYNNKVSPQRDVTLLARRVLPGGELRCAAVECYRRRQKTTTDDRRQRPLLVWPPTLCVDGPVITRPALMARALLNEQRPLHCCHSAHPSLILSFTPGLKPTCFTNPIPP